MWERSPAVTPKINCLPNATRIRLLGEEKSFVGFKDAYKVAAFILQAFFIVFDGQFLKYHLLSGFKQHTIQQFQ